MPIAKHLRHHYTAASGWPGVRARVLARARYRCQQCGKPNHTHVETRLSSVAGQPRMWWRSAGSGWHSCEGVKQTPPRLYRVARTIYVVLTVAHLNHVAGDNRDENLRALCQWCHLNFDRLHHKETRSTRRDRARPILRLSEEDLMTPIIPEYAALSVRAGLIAGKTDEFLGGTAFIEFIRFHAWTLTPRLLLEMQSAALSLGVPAERFDNIDGFAAELLASHEFVRRAVALQAEAEQKGTHHGRPV